MFVYRLVHINKYIHTFYYNCGHIYDCILATSNINSSTFTSIFLIPHLHFFFISTLDICSSYIFIYFSGQIDIYIYLSISNSSTQLSTLAHIYIQTLICTIQIHLYGYFSLLTLCVCVDFMSMYWNRNKCIMYFDKYTLCGSFN